MRYSDFKLFESNLQSDLEAQKAIHDLDVISDTVRQLPSEKQNLKINIAKKLQAISASISSFLQKANIQSQTPNNQVKEDANDSAIFSTIETLKQQILAVESSNIDEKIKKQFITPFRQQIDILTNQVAELKTVKDAAVVKQEEAETFVKDVSKYLVILGNKVQGYEEEDLSSMSSKDKVLARKRAINAQEFSKTLKQALFGKIVDIQEEADVTTEEIKQFLKACVAGNVINMLSLIQTKRGNVKDHVNPKYQKLFNIFVEQNIFSYSPGKTSGNIGPGEMALSMMGNPAEKAKKGDLKVGDIEVEIKASASTGGRLNSKAMAAATTGWKVWSKNISEILQSAPEDRNINITDKKGNRIKVPLKGWDGNSRGKTGKLGSTFNWNDQGFRNLNEQVLEPYSDFDKTFKLFHETIFTLVQNIDKIPNADKMIASAINQDGTVDKLKMDKAYTKIAYESYSLTDDIKTILFLRTDTLDYTIIYDGNDLMNQLGNTVTTGYGFNWNDDQQTPTPSYIAVKQ
jgi:hypothetical protein